MPSSPSLRRALVAVTLVCALAAGAAPRVVLDKGVACPSAKDVHAALKARAGHARGTLRIRKDGEQRIEVRYQPRDGSAPLKRSVEVGSDCASVPEAIALLVEAWEGTHLKAPVQPSIQPESSRGQPVAAQTQAPAQPEAPIQPESSRGPSAAETLDVAVEELPLALSAPSPAFSAPTSLVPPAGPLPEIITAPVEPAFTVSPELVLFGSQGTFVGGDAATSAGARVLATVRHPFGVGLQGRWESARVAAAAPGSVRYEVTAADLLGRYSFHPPSQSGVEILAGFGVQRITAQAQGFTVNDSATLYDPELTLGAEWHQRLGGGAFLKLFGTAEARLRAEAFEVKSVGRVAALPPVSARLGVGLGWSFF